MITIVISGLEIPSGFEFPLTILNCVSVINSNLCLVLSWSITMGFEVDITLSHPDLKISYGFLKIKQTNEKLYSQISSFPKSFCLWTWQKKACKRCKFIFVNSYIGILSWQRNYQKMLEGQWAGARPKSPGLTSQLTLLEQNVRLADLLMFLSTWFLQRI